ncbi:MAG: DUF1015 domain-containing protein, partial [Chitinispirillaceae bacterium]|nr:DUF1015 domain-containing protein [Chitinispirillaceae bacterium]
SILIADGHHRYETSLNFYRNNMKPEYSYTLMTLVSTADPGLIIRPFHRVIRKDNRNIVILKELGKFFTIENKGKVNLEIIHRFIEEDRCQNLLYLDFSDNKLYLCSLNSNGENYISEV